MIRTCGACGQKNRVGADHLADQGRCGACRAALPPLAEPLDVDAEGFDEVVRGAKVPVLVDFWAAWCGPCRAVAPQVKKVAADLSGRALVLKVDTDRHPQVAARFGVQGIPNFLVFRGGKPVMQQAGAVDASTLRRWLESAGA